MIMLRITMILPGLLHDFAKILQWSCKDFLTILPRFHRDLAKVNTTVLPRLLIILPRFHHYLACHLGYNLVKNLSRSWQDCQSGLPSHARIYEDKVVSDNNSMSIWHITDISDITNFTYYTHTFTSGTQFHAASY